MRRYYRHGLEERLDVLRSPERLIALRMDEMHMVSALNDE